MARRVTPVQVIALGCAGVGAFYAAAQLSGGSAASEAAASDVPVRVMTAAPRPAAFASSAFASSAFASSAFASSASATTASATAASATAASATTASASAASDPASSPSRATALVRDRSAVIPGSTGDPFATLSWLPPPPPPPPPVAAPPPPPPAAPVAPPLPFAFVGMVEQGTPKPEAFLSKGEALLIVSAGDTIDGGVYRVESMNSNQVVITHLPTNTQQTINVSGGSK